MEGASSLHRHGLCWACQKNIIFVYRSANCQRMRRASICFNKSNTSLSTVQQERSLYNDMVRRAKDVCLQLGLGELTACAPCSRHIERHYNFDYAQQVHLPSDPLQPGPIYFLVPRKVGLFGVCCEGVPRQVKFLTDEAHLFSKGANAVTSYLHYFLSISTLVRPKQTVTVTTAQDKTRTVFSCGIVLGGFPLVFTKR